MAGESFAGMWPSWKGRQMKLQRLKLGWIWSIGFALASCTGELTSTESNISDEPRDGAPGIEPPPTQSDALSCEELPPTAIGFTPLRRLTRSQYANAIRDLLDVAIDVSSFPADTRAGPFSSNAITSVSSSHVQAYIDSAEAIATTALLEGKLDERLDCEPVDAACIQQFASTFGRRAFRRPLSERELDDVLNVYTQNGSDPTPGGAIPVVQAILSAPQFLYHVEVLPEGDVEPATGYELAARLAFFLWDSPPDLELLDAAESGGLEDDEALNTQVERMLADERSENSIDRFTSEWLGIAGVDRVSRDQELFPDFDQEIAEAMKNETLRFVRHVFFYGDGSLATLLNSDYSILDRTMADWYELDVDVGFLPEEVSLPEERAGVLTQASVMTATSFMDHASPIKRGVFLLDNVLCHEIQFPEGLEIPPLPDPEPGQTNRERFAIHTSADACAVCHTIIDPLGFAFERFDAVGRYHDMEEGQPVDDSGEIKIGAADVDGPVAGGAEFASRLAGSQTAGECFVKQMHRFALARDTSRDDRCTLQRLSRSFEDSDQDIRQLVREIALSESFRWKRRPQTSEETQ